MLAAAIVLGCPSAEVPPDAEADGAIGAAPTSRSPSPLVASSSDSAPAYVGRAVCAGCHPAAAVAWAGSDHDRAMQVATRESVLGDFEDRSFQHYGVTTRFSRVGEEYRITTEGPGGARAEYDVEYTFGVRPLQQYLLEIEPGRLQAFVLAWDTEANEWFSLYADEPIRPDDPLHWTRPAQNWNRNCAECHSTGLAVNYQADTRSYRTSWRELDVSCEACHGPGSAHVAWADQEGQAAGDHSNSGPASVGLPVRFEAATPAERDRAVQATELQVCAPCHSRRSRVYPGGGPGSRFLDHFRPALLTQGLYRADGQIEDEVFVYGSFLQSRMYAEGVRCSHCHDPHTARLVAEGNALCGQCHEPAVYDVAAHHHHAPDSVGSECVSCHMASTTYMGVDARRDHGFHLPRPDLTLEIGVPNACSGCHADQRAADAAAGEDASGAASAAWASARIEEWFGAERPDDRHGSRALAAGRAGAPGAVEALASLAANAERPGIVRATAFELLTPSPATEGAQHALRVGLSDADPLVRTAAVSSLEGRAGEQVVRLLAPLLADPIRSVRMEAARVLAPSVAQLPGDDQGLVRRYGAALEEYLEGQRALAEWPGAHLNLAVIHQQLERPDWAKQAYASALALEPDFVPARYNLALLHNAMGKPAAAEAELRKVIELAPEFADGYYSLGLLLAADEARMEEAAAELETAARLAPDRGRVLYNAGIAQQTLGHALAAERLLQAAIALEPGEADFVTGLAILYTQQNRRQDALPWVHRLLELRPDDTLGRALRDDLARAAAAPPTSVP